MIPKVLLEEIQREIETSIEKEDGLNPEGVPVLQTAETRYNAPMVRPPKERRSTTKA